METFYIWRRKGNFWHRVEVSKEKYDDVASASIETAIRRDLDAIHGTGRTYETGNNYEHHGPMISRGDGTKYREQRLK